MPGRPLLVALIGLAASCAGRPDAGSGEAVLHHDPGPLAAPPSSASARASAPRTGRFAIDDAPLSALPIEILPIPGGEAVLFVSQFADERPAWARRLDGATGALGPVIALADQHILGAFDWPGGRTTVATTRGAELCLATYVGAIAEPQERTCAAVAPIAVVPVASRLALLEVTAMDVPAAHASAHPAAAPARPSRPAREKPPPSPARTKRGAAATKKASKKAPVAAAHHAPPRTPVEVHLRWATASAIDPEAAPTGLHFDQPLGGMGLVDARARGPGIDLVWYETSTKKTRSALGSARLMAGSLRADGTLDFKSRVAVIEGDLEYGAIRDHHGVRLAGLANASIYVGLDAKGQCEATRILPALARITAYPAVCAVDPDRLLAPPGDIGALETLLAAGPRRAFGQPPRDPGLVAWAGERGYFLHDGALQSASRSDGVARDEPPPLAGHRSRIAWGSIAPDGEGLAVIGNQLVHLDAQGRVDRAPAPSREADLRASIVHAPEDSADRRRAARIGASWWVARGDVIRLLPEPLCPPALRGKASIDAGVLVGGADRGLLLAIDGAALQLTTVDAAGATVPVGLPSSVSPVRVGFDACERAGGGALVAGVSAADPTKVLAFAVDLDGHTSAPVTVSLPITAGDLAVRMIPLPGGGALLTDRDRRHVVWLDATAHPVADAPYPLAEGAALCLDGRPARKVVPAPTPGSFVAIPDLAAGDACVLGDPVWTPGGELRWFGSAVRGLDSIPEAGIIPIAGVCAAVAQAPSSPVLPDPTCRPAPAPPCPSDMVSIAGRYCIDRFESALVDAATGNTLSPDYPTTPGLLDFALGEWATARSRTGTVQARAFPLPFLAPERLGKKIEARAENRLGARPSGYVTGVVAASACAAAGKRLCILDEFVTACRGEDDTLFPYGDTYEDGVCNVFREEHPAAILHSNASMGHLDPRLNRVDSKGKPLFQRTGESPACRSRWGNDAAYDLTGNLDEWVAEGTGAFAGGFYSRSTRAGCDALVTAHPFSYLDYSTGVRCCRDAAPAAAP
ncbi:MAG: hypothetical protein ABJE95_12685 [Byssovorax sp.]